MRDFIEPSFRDLTERYYEMGMKLQSITDPAEHQKFLLRLADMTKEMEIKHWLEQPVPPFIGGWNAMSMNDELVVFLDRTMETKELKKVLGQLQQVKANVLGIAFNFVNHKEKNYYYNRYYRYGKHHKAEHDMTDTDIHA